VGWGPDRARRAAADPDPGTGAPGFGRYRGGRGDEVERDGTATPRGARADRQQARVDGSRPISRVLSGTVIHLGCTSPCTSSDLPGNACGPHAADGAACPPIWSCSGWGLPCHRRCRRRGALLPHLFTLTGPSPDGLRRCLFCGTFRRLAPPRNYLAPCPVEPGLSSPASIAGATARPTPCTQFTPGSAW